MRFFFWRLQFAIYFWDRYWWATWKRSWQMSELYRDDFNAGKSPRSSI